MADRYLQDDIFSKDLIKSMKSQMVPSDDVINSLLAAISSETSFNSESCFDSGDTGSAEVRKIRRRKSRFDLRAASRYIAAVAAALIMIVGTVSLIGNGDDNRLKKVINDVVENPAVAPVLDEEESLKQGNIDIISDDDEGDKTPIERTATENTETKDNEDKSPREKDEKDKKAGESETENKSNTVSDRAHEVTKGGEKPVENDKDGGEKGDNTDTAVESVWVKEVLAVEAPQAVLMGESYAVSDAAATISGSDAGNLAFRVSDEESGTDETTHKVRAKKIKKVSPNIMVGVIIPDTGEKLIYINRDYAPSTLGEFLKDSGISGNIDFETVVYTEKNQKTKNSDYYSVDSAEAGEIMSEFVFSQSYADTIGSAYNNREETFVTLISSRNQNPLGLDIKFEVNQNGHLYISLSSGNSFTFYIGEDQTDELIDSIRSNL